MCVFFNRHCYAIKEKITQAGVFEFFSGVAAGALSTLAIKLFPFMDLYRIIIASIICNEGCSLRRYCVKHVQTHRGSFSLDLRQYLSRGKFRRYAGVDYLPHI